MYEDSIRVEIPEGFMILKEHEVEGKTFYELVDGEYEVEDNQDQWPEFIKAVMFCAENGLIITSSIKEDIRETILLQYKLLNE